LRLLGFVAEGLSGVAISIIFSFMTFYSAFVLGFWFFFSPLLVATVNVLIGYSLVHSDAKVFGYAVVVSGVAISLYLFSLVFSLTAADFY